MPQIVGFTDTDASHRDISGGKGAHLSSMAAAGFPVPGGFVVTVEAFESAVTGLLGTQIDALLEGVDFSHADNVEAVSAKVRALVEAVEIPADLADDIRVAYGKFGDGTPVAVRSSGTAEDMAEASFAGQHDTYLDIHGAEAVLDAIRRCWASMYTGRAVAYRHEKSVDGTRARLAVVVQEMVAAEVSGVMFTANPFSSATDEIVVNASWGLGEGVVSGILTPDQFTLDFGTLELLDTVVGAKEVRVIRNPETGQGTITEHNADQDRGATTLTAAHLAELGAIGRRIQSHFGELPQDIEWAWADGQFYILQSRNVTGVEFTWDDHVDAWQWSEDDRDTIWTRAFADEYWTGAVTPLFYSVRAQEQTSSYQRSAKLWGADKLATLPQFKYHKAEVYFSVTNQETFLESTCPPMFRAGASGYLPPSRAAAVADTPFSIGNYVKIHARVMGLDPTQGFVRWLDTMDNFMNNHVEEANGKYAAELSLLSDRELKKYINHRVDYMEEVLYNMWSGFQIHASAALNGLGTLLAKWYDGDNAMVFVDLITGLPKRTTTLQENLDLWELADGIRKSPALTKLFQESGEDEFFDRLLDHPEGAKTRRLYDQLIAEHGHRGHADRDFIYDRRSESPAIDYRSIRALLTADGSVRPVDQEERQAAKREAATADVVERLRAKPFGRLRADGFLLLLGYVHRFMALRDDERHYIDRITLSKKRAFLEVGRRLVERGDLDTLRDVYFLTKDELFEALDGNAPMKLLKAKVDGRSKQFELFDTKKAIPPLYMQRGAEWVDPTTVDAAAVDPNALQGLPTSPGQYTGRARVVHELSDIGRLEHGDILITNSTDPGWTPVFAVIGGLVLETGGMLAHGSCLSREYGLPAMTVANACSLIEDGAIITIDGNTGMVTRVEQLKTSGSPE
jgi:rifampicin phosphotransferase